MSGLWIESSYVPLSNSAEKLRAEKNNTGGAPAPALKLVNKTLARTDKFLSPANEWSGALPYGEEDLHCAYTVQCVTATVSNRPLLYNKRASAKESSTLVAPQI